MHESSHGAGSPVNRRRGATRESTRVHRNSECQCNGIPKKERHNRRDARKENRGDKESEPPLPFTRESSLENRRIDRVRHNMRKITTAITTPASRGNCEERNNTRDPQEGTVSAGHRNIQSGIQHVKKVQIFFNPTSYATAC